MKNIHSDIIPESTAGKPASDVVLEVTNLRKGFGNQEVLKNISLKLYNSENLVILGKSGSGK